MMENIDEVVSKHMMSLKDTEKGSGKSLEQEIPTEDLSSR